MAFGYRRVDRDQSFLLPPDMREWLPSEHLVWFVLEVVRGLDTSALHARSRRGGVGREGYDPDMLLALLTYAYCHGMRSSRAIERACQTDVAFRVLCAQDTPDHSTIARFRQGHEQGLADLFTQVLVLCARNGLGRFGTVAIDGTKIAANASIDATRSEAALRRIAKELIQDAAATDAAEDEQYGDARGDELPEQWRDPSGRAGRIAAALAELEAEKAARARAADQAVRQAQGEVAQRRVKSAEETVARQRRRQQERVAAHLARRRADGSHGPGRPPVPVEEHIDVRRAKEQLRRAQRLADAAKTATAPPSDQKWQANTTDPASRVMKTRKGWIQGFNCQLAVAGDGVILAATATQDGNDQAQFVPMMNDAVDAVRGIREATGRRDATIGTVLADAGYASQTNLTSPGPDRLIALGKGKDVQPDPAPAPPPGPDADAREQMAHRLAIEEGARLYRRRGATVEPANAHLKDRRGLRTFSRRGLTAVDSELKMAAWITNLLKIYTARTAAAT
jgi:transposase